jgi:hypothetical protein
LLLFQVYKQPKLSCVVKLGKAGSAKLERIKGEMRRKYINANNHGLYCGPSNYRCSNPIHSPPIIKKRKKASNKESPAVGAPATSKKRGLSTPLKTAFRQILLMCHSKDFIMTHNYGGGEGPGPTKRTGLSDEEVKELEEIACKCYIWFHYK